MFEYDIDEGVVLGALDSAGLKHINRGRYILSCCPMHEEKNPSAQIFKDSWWVQCYAGCGRFHITHAFPELKTGAAIVPRRTVEHVEEKRDVTPEILEEYNKLPTVPEDYELKKGLPASELNKLGWKWDSKNWRFLIPYYAMDKKTIKFAQWRNLKGNVRFNFWSGGTPTMYGLWNLVGAKEIMLVEGSSDGIVLGYCGQRWISAPSASSVALIKRFAKYCDTNGISIIYGGDNDTAGDSLMDALNGVADYIVVQPPKEYKDWGEFFEAEGREKVGEYIRGAKAKARKEERL